MTLIELVIGMLIVALLVATGAPSFSKWIQSSQIRTAAEAVQNGLQLARATAVQRNATISFQLMTTLDSSCALAVAGPDWVISQPVGVASAAGSCDSAPADPPTNGAAPSASDPYIVQKRPAAEGSRNAVLAASQSAVNFNGLGRVTPVAAADITIDITNPAGGTCAASGGTMRCLRVVVSPNGQIRMCDPAIALSAANPQGC